MLVHIVIVYVLGNVRIELSADLICLPVEDDDVDGHVILKQKLADCINGNSQCLILRITVDAGRNKGESNRLAPVLLCQSKGGTIAGDELFTLTMLTVPPSGTYGMDHILAGQLVALCNFGAAGFAAAQRLAFVEQFRSCSAMNAAVNTPATEKR